MAEKEKTIPFTQVMAALKDESTPFPPKYLHKFSDLEGNNLANFKKTWAVTTSRRKVNLLRDLEDLAESETLVCFDNIARIGLNDSNPQVRAVSARLLWEAEDEDLIPIFTRMMLQDADESARSAGAAALGRFVLLGDLEDLPPATLKKVEDNLLKVCNGNDHPKVRQRALESLGYSNRDEVIPLIQKALDSRDQPWVTSALFAISRSLDERWEKTILKMMRDPDDEIRFEAFRAAGELELISAREPLLDLLENETEEGDNKLAVIWSLSQIGGEDVQEALEKALKESEDDEEEEYIEEALNNLNFNDDFHLADIMDLPMDPTVFDKDSPKKHLSS
jgi:HEAT repeat protein